MNAKFCSVVGAGVGLLLAACGSSPQSLILGKWEVENAPMKMTAEFDRDGSARITMLGQTVRGTYKVNGGDELEWSVNGMATKSKVAVTGTELELTNDQNQTVRYRRR